ncbi:DNA primase, partial [Staphylococcus epidermidis]|nr:DNA primase [Staphylococcus epidermidis]
MNNTMKLAEQLLSENKEAIDREGLIALLQSPTINDKDEEDLPQAEAIYNLLIEELNFEISTDINYRSNIYSYYGIKNKPKDTDLVQMATQILNVKRFESKLFVFSKEGWQKLDDSELRSIVGKTIQVILIDYTPTQSELKSVIDGMKEFADIDELVEDERYIGCHHYLFDLEQFQVIDNSIDIFPKTRLDVELDKSDSITSSVPSHFGKYISELANFDDDLKYFLMQHTAVLFTSNHKLRRGL